MIRHHVVDNDDLLGDFKEYTEKVLELKGLSNEMKLEFYGLYKQATCGPCNSDKPSLFDFRGQAKHQAWKELGDLSSSDAMLQYIDLYNSLDESDLGGKEDDDEDKTKVQSTLYKDEEDAPLDKNDIWHAVRHGHVTRLSQIFAEENKTDVDEEGRTLLHWAVDRNHIDTTKWLIKNGCDVNAQDSDGCTPLHYAVTCDHVLLVRVLLDAGSSLTIKDGDGLSAVELCENDEVANMLQHAQQPITPSLSADV